MLGSEQSAVRLAAVYALAALADDWPAGRQTCVDVLCAYMRMPYTLPSAAPSVGSELAPPAGGRERDATAADGGRNPVEEQQVRQTVMRVIAEHLRPNIGEISTSWALLRFDFTGAVIDGHTEIVTGTLIGQMVFDGAVILGPFLQVRADLPFHSKGVSFHGTQFRGGTVVLELSAARISFRGASVDDAVLDILLAPPRATANIESATKLDLSNLVVISGELTVAPGFYARARPSISEQWRSWGASNKLSRIEGTLRDAKIVGGHVVLDGANRMPSWSGGTRPMPLSRDTRLDFLSWNLDATNLRLRSGRLVLWNLTIGSAGAGQERAIFPTHYLTFDGGELSGGELLIGNVTLRIDANFTHVRVDGTTITFQQLTFENAGIDLRAAIWRPLPILISPIGK